MNLTRSTSSMLVPVPAPDLDLRPERREEIVRAIARVLTMAMPGSHVALRGSLATGRADQFSDIDLLWSVPVRHVETAVDAVLDALSAVAPVASIRSDPDLLASNRRRLLFVRLAGLPLFWRVDLDVEAALAGEPPDAVPSPVAATAEWSSAASAIANAVAAVKAVLRGQFLDAGGLLERGFERMGLTYDLQEGWARSVVRLAHAAADADRAVAELADEVTALAVACSHIDHPPSPTSQSSGRISRTSEAANKVVFSTTLDAVSTAKTRLERSFDADSIRDMTTSATSDLTVAGPNRAAHASRGAGR